MDKFLKSEAVWAYCAGIIDGEGWIGISRLRTKGRKGSPSESNVYEFLQFQIQVMNTSEAMVDFLHANFGGYKTYGKRPNKKPYYKWGIRHSDADEFLKKIYPYLVAKRDQAEVVFRFRATFGERRNYVSPEAKAIREECYVAIKRLKAA